MQARQAVETARMIGMAANLRSVVDPSIVVLGGSMFAQANRSSTPCAVVRRLQRNPFDVVPSLGKEAPLAGGLLVAGATRGDG